MNTILENVGLNVVDMKSLYETTVENVELILKKRYKMSASEAKMAVFNSPLKLAFDEDAEMAAHTSNEAWARKIYNFWIKSN